MTTWPLFSSEYPATSFSIGALWFVLDAAVLWKNRPYSPVEMRLFLWGWNIAALLGIFWNWSHGTLTRLNLFFGLQM